MGAGTLDPVAAGIMIMVKMPRYLMMLARGRVAAGFRGAVVTALLLTLWPAPAAFGRHNAEQYVVIKINVVSPDGTPIRNAGVVIKQVTNARNQPVKHPLHIELKTDPRGNCTTDLFEPGTVEVQIIASGFQTFGQYYSALKPQDSINIKLAPPKSQISIYR
jgi:hypothetical protein